MSPLAIGLILSSCLANDPAVAAVRKSVAPFEGTWQAMSLEINGQQVPEENVKKIQFVIAGNQMNSRVDDGIRITFKVYPDTTPVAMDLDLALGPNAERREHFEAIGLVEGDTLKLCWNNGQGVKQRPGAFSGAAETNNFLLIFKRVPR